MKGMEHDPSRSQRDGVPFHLLATASLADDRNTPFESAAIPDWLAPIWEPT